MQETAEQTRLIEAFGDVVEAAALAAGLSQPDAEAAADRGEATMRNHYQRTGRAPDVAQLAAWTAGLIGREGLRPWADAVTVAVEVARALDGTIASKPTTPGGWAMSLGAALSPVLSFALDVAAKRRPVRVARRARRRARRAARKASKGGAS